MGLLGAAWFTRQLWSIIQYNIYGLHRDFETAATGIMAGPASSFCWILQEFLAVALSFGLRGLYQIWQVVFLAALWPIKFLDVILIHMPGAENAASVWLGVLW